MFLDVVEDLPQILATWLPMGISWSPWAPETSGVAAAMAEAMCP